VKFNRQLLEYASEASHYGIPIFAGVPLVSRLRDFNQECKIAWFKINPSSSLKCFDEWWRLDVPSGKRIEEPDESVVDMIEDPLDSITAAPRWISMNKSLDYLRELRRRTRPLDRFLFGSIYKPFHLILRARQT